MALINCPECGKEVSSKASKCVNFGYPLEKTMVGIVSLVMLVLTPIWGIILYAYLAGGLNISGFVSAVIAGGACGLCSAIDETVVKKAGYEVDKKTSSQVWIIPLYLYRRMKLIGKNAWICTVMWFIFLAIMLFWMFCL